MAAGHKFAKRCAGAIQAGIEMC